MLSIIFEVGCFCLLNFFRDVDGKLRRDGSALCHVGLECYMCLEGPNLSAFHIHMHNLTLFAIFKKAKATTSDITSDHPFKNRH